MALLGREDPSVLLMTATIPARRIYTFFLWMFVSITVHNGERETPYHTPIVRVLRVSIRERHNDPLVVIWLAMQILFFNLDPMIDLPGVSREGRGRFICTVAICEQSVPSIARFERLDTSTYVFRLIQRAFKAFFLPVCIRGDSNVMIEALEPLTVLKTAHVPYWRALKLSTTDLEIYNGDSKVLMV